MDDDPPVFDTAAEAWEYLREDREASEEQAADSADGFEYSPVVGWLRSQTVPGSVSGGTPGADAVHDLGLVYEVTEIDDPEPEEEEVELEESRIRVLEMPVAVQYPGVDERVFAVASPGGGATVSFRLLTGDAGLVVTVFDRSSSSVEVLVGPVGSGS
jgi:hypothetical protein